MNIQHLIAVFPDRMRAEAAYTALENENLPREAIHLIGKGYKSADEYGLTDPAPRARRQFGLLRHWLVPFGFAAGFAFNVLTGIDIFVPGADPIDPLVGGLLGAAAGLMGSYFTGGLSGAASAGDALTYRNRLEAGKYLVAVRGPAALIDRATPILQRLRPENLQGYAESERAQVS
jgi:hypothetical protein